MVGGGDGAGGGRHSEPSVHNSEDTEEMPIPRLSLVPNNEEVSSDSYDDPKLVYSSIVLRSLEKYLPPEILELNRNEKIKYMSDVLRKYISPEDCNKAQLYKNYREMISSYEPCYRGWYNFDPKLFLLPSFLEAISVNTEASFRRIIFQPHPSVFVFEMFQQDFFDKLIVEAETFRKWAQEKNYRIRRLNNTGNYGVVLDDFGLDIMLNKLMQDFIFPLCQVFFHELRGAMFDSHHGFFNEYGHEKDPELGKHIDHSEITLNVCLKKQLEGGEILFTGTRCNKHMWTKYKAEEMFRYTHIPGYAILHRGRHRHSPIPTTAPRYRANMVLYCRSSLFREMETYQKDYFSDWCGQCAQESKFKESQFLDTRREEMIRIEDGAKRSTEKPWRVYVRRSNK